MARGNNCILRGGGWRGGGVLGVVLIICIKWPPGVFSFEFGNFGESGDSGKSGDSYKIINLAILVIMVTLVFFCESSDSQESTEYGISCYFKKIL